MDSEGRRPTDKWHLPRYQHALDSSAATTALIWGSQSQRPTSQVNLLALKLPCKIFTPQICTSLRFLLKMSFQVRIYGSVASIRRDRNAGWRHSSTTSLTSTSHFSIGVISYSALPIPFCQKKHSWGTQWTGKKNRHEQKVKVWGERQGEEKWIHWLPYW